MNVECKEHGKQKAFKFNKKAFCPVCIEEKVFKPRLEDYEEVQ